MMEKVRVIARAVAKPGKGSRLRRLLSGMLAPTRAEDGCEFYDLFESHQPGRFYFYELWTSKEALARHAATSHYKHLETALKELLNGSFEVNLVQAV